MFAPSYYAPRYFAPRYFAPNTDAIAQIIDRTDAPIGQSGSARRWIRSRVGGKTYDNIRDALKAIERAKRKPSRKTVKKAVGAIQKAVGTNYDPYDFSSVIRGREAIRETQEPDISALLRAMRQLELLAAAFEAFHRKDKQEEEAVIALLLLA